MDGIGLCGFVCFNRRSPVKILATVMRLQFVLCNTPPFSGNRDLPKTIYMVTPPTAVQIRKHFKHVSKKTQTRITSSQLYA